MKFVLVPFDLLLPDLLPFDLLLPRLLVLELCLSFDLLHLDLLLLDLLPRCVVLLSRLHLLDMPSPLRRRATFIYTLSLGLLLFHLSLSTAECGVSDCP